MIKNHLDVGTEVSVNLCKLCYNGAYRKVRPKPGKKSIVVIYGNATYSDDFTDTYKVARLCGEVFENTKIDLLKYMWIPVIRCAFDKKTKVSNVKNCLQHLYPYIGEKVVLFGVDALSYLFYEGHKPPNMAHSHGQLITNKSIGGKQVELISLIGTEIFDKHENDPILLEEKLSEYGKLLQNSGFSRWS